MGAVGLVHRELADGSTKRGVGRGARHPTLLGCGDLSAGQIGGCSARGRGEGWGNEVPGGRAGMTRRSSWRGTRQGLGEGRRSGGGCEGDCHGSGASRSIASGGGGTRCRIGFGGRAGISWRTEGAGITGEGAASRGRRRRGQRHEHRGGGGEGTRGYRGSGAWGGGGSATTEPCTIVEYGRLRYKHKSSKDKDVESFFR
jgi:hypothetical protein